MGKGLAQQFGDLKASGGLPSLWRLFYLLANDKKTKRTCPVVARRAKSKAKADTQDAIFVYSA